MFKARSSLLVCDSCSSSPLPSTHRDAAPGSIIMKRRKIRVVIPDASQVVVTVHGLRLRAGRVEARLCDKDAGSRGNLLLRIKRVALEQGIGENNPRAHSLQPRRDGSDSRGHVHDCSGSADRGRDAVNVYRAPAAAGSTEGVKGSKNSDVFLSSDSGSHNTDSEEPSEQQTRDARGSTGHVSRKGVDPLASHSASVGAGSGARQTHLDVRPGFESDHFGGGISGIGGNAGGHGRDMSEATESTVGGEEEEGSSWFSSGGVAPDLELLHSDLLDARLASLGEDSADESDGRDAGETRGGTTRTLAAAASASGPRADGDTGDQNDHDDDLDDDGGNGGSPSSGGGAGVGVEGDGGSGEGSLGEGSLEGEEGGKWDSHMDAMTRAAWLSSKQANHRGFNSNASTASAVSTTGSSAPGGAFRSLAADAGSAPASIVRSVNTVGRNSGSGNRDERRTPPVIPARDPTNPPTNTPAESFFDSVAHFFTGHAGAGRSVVDTGKSPAVVCRTEVAGQVSTRQQAQAAENVRGRTVLENERAGGAEVRDGGSNRISGSGFLYRVVVDGLNILITLKLR